MNILKSFLHAAWGLVPRSFHWRLLWLANPKFNVGVACIVVNSEGAVLLLRHVYRTKILWELPTGWIHSGETVERAAARELLEETGLILREIRVLKINSGFKLRVEVILTAQVENHKELRCGTEIFDAKFFGLNELPFELKEEHRAFISEAFGSSS